MTTLMMVPEWKETVDKWGEVGYWLEDFLEEEVQPQFKNNYFAEMRIGSEEGSYLRLIDLCRTLRTSLNYVVPVSLGRW